MKKAKRRFPPGLATDPVHPPELRGWTRERRLDCWIYTRDAGEVIMHFPKGGKWKAVRGNADGVAVASAEEAAALFEP
jgi:hypothetical protein